MKLLLDIQDSKADALMQVLKDLRYVKTQLISPAKAQFLTELSEAVTELNLVKAGKKKARNAEDFLNELKSKNTFIIRKTSKAVNKKIPIA